MLKVKVYSSPHCMWCTKLKEYFKKKEIEYEEINVLENKDAAEEMIAKSGQMTIPVTEIGDKIIVGYKPDEIEEHLNGGK